MTNVRKALAFVVGVILGGMLLVYGLLVYPFPHASRTERVMPKFVSDYPYSDRYRLMLSDDLISVSTSNRPAIIPIKPVGVKQLTSPNVRDGLAMITLLRNRSGHPIGFATELEAGHEDSSLLTGKIMTHTTWTLVLPGRGVLVMYQVEDNWILFKRFILPRVLFGGSWQGSWKNLNTLGPSPQGYGEIIAGTGAFTGKRGHFLEYADLRKFTIDKDFVGILDLYVAPE